MYTRIRYYEKGTARDECQSIVNIREAKDKASQNYIILST